MTIPTDGRIDLDALAELAGPLRALSHLGSIEDGAIVAQVGEALPALIDLARRAAIPSEQGEAVALGSEDDPESLAYALRIGAMGTPFNDYQGTLYMNPRYKSDDYRDAEFRDYGLARAVRVILNNAEAIRAALAHPAPAAGVKVKALRWLDVGTPTELDLIAHTPFDTFHISRDGACEWPIILRPFIAGQSNYQTVDEAKVAAQAAYEARILSALDQGEPK